MLTPIEDILKEAAAGKMFILVDDDTRENEGDLVIPAEFADAAAINFMAKHARGLICLPMESARIRELGLPPMAMHNASRHQTAFTVSIEAREGISTGISAADRARTIAVAIDKKAKAGDIISPGHVFPLEAREGGVLVRAGHTEAAVDISRMAGCRPAAVICEIMNDDGTMARLPDLQKFAKKRKLKIATIADLIAYRIKHDTLVRREMSVPFSSKWGGEFTLHLYTNIVEYAEHLALVKGEICPDKPTLVRVHALDVLGDVLGETGSGSKQKSLEIIGKEGGILILIREGKATSLSESLRKKSVVSSPWSVEDKTPATDHRLPTSTLKDYGIGAQILRDLGVREMILMTSHPDRPVIGLEGYGLKVTGTRSLR